MSFGVKHKVLNHKGLKGWHKGTQSKKHLIVDFFTSPQLKGYM